MTLKEEKTETHKEGKQLCEGKGRHWSDPTPSQGMPVASSIPC
jgi:hypothetical protein